MSLTINNVLDDNIKMNQRVPFKLNVLYTEIQAEMLESVPVFYSVANLDIFFIYITSF